MILMLSRGKTCTIVPVLTRSFVQIFTSQVVNQRRICWISESHNERLLVWCPPVAIRSLLISRSIALYTEQIYFNV